MTDSEFLNRMADLSERVQMLPLDEEGCRTLRRIATALAARDVTGKPDGAVEATPLVPLPRPPFYFTAIYWPRDGSYGGASRAFASILDAETDAELHKRMGYGRKECPIHIIRRTPDVIEKIIDNQEEKK